MEHRWQSRTKSSELSARAHTQTQTHTLEYLDTRETIYPTT